MTTHTAFKTLVTIVCFTSIAAGEIEIKETNKALTAFASGKPVLSYHIETVTPPNELDPIYSRSGFIHPLHSPSGKVLTDAFPIGHVHQHAVFNAWTRATFKHEVVDFWNQHQKLGTVRHKQVSEVANDSFRVTLEQISLKKGAAIDEAWNVRVSEEDGVFIIDIEIEQQCATTEEIYLHPYHYGGFGFRGSAHWNADDITHFETPMEILTSDGKRDRVTANHTTPDWIAVFGRINGEEAGFAVLDHPSNFRYPQPIRIHQKMPYFVFSPVVKGSFILKPGFSYRSKYRIITFDGAADAELIKSWHKSYSDL